MKLKADSTETFNQLYYLKSHTNNLNFVNDD